MTVDNPGAKEYRYDSENNTQKLKEGLLKELWDQKFVCRVSKVKGWFARRQQSHNKQIKNKKWNAKHRLERLEMWHAKFAALQNANEAEGAIQNVPNINDKDASSEEDARRHFNETQPGPSHSVD